MGPSSSKGALLAARLFGSKEDLQQLGDPLAARGPSSSKGAFHLQGGPLTARGPFSYKGATVIKRAF